MDFLRILINKISIVFVALILVVSSVNANSRLEVGDWDIDDDGRADALTDGLLFLRYAFELRGDALISGLISSSSEYTTASDIERELALVYDASGDIDGDGNVDALTDGLLLLRYLFGLSGETLTVGVVANGATRTSSSDLEGFIGNLMPSAPYITLLGSAVLDHEQATDYVDAGATAMDYADGSVAVSVSGSVNSSVAGVYVLTYTAVDSEGNTAKPLTRTVTVADTTAPVITLLGESTVEVDQNASYTDAGATATDAVDGSVEVVTSGSVDTSAAGTYTITYTATDTSNNSASVDRVVNVIKGINLSVESLTGNWRVKREAGSLHLTSADTGEVWWSNSEIDVWRRSCFFDDIYTFGQDGAFSQDMGLETWLEPFQGVDQEGCGTPVSPHNGNVANANYVVSDSQITVNGLGAFLGLAKATNGAELSSSAEAVSSITYDVLDFSNDGLNMTIQIDVGNSVWRFKLSKYDGTDPISQFGTGIDKVLNIGEVIDFESTSADYGLVDFGGVAGAIVTDPTDENNKVVSLIKSTDAETWAGTTIASGSIFYPLSSTEAGMTLRVWSPAAGVQVKVKLEESGDSTRAVETDAVTSVSSGWETLTFDFRNHSEGTPALNPSYVFDTLIVYMNYGVVGLDETYYLDDIKFIGEIPLDVTASSLAGNWKMSPEAGAFSVGWDAANVGGWYSSSASDVTTRSCFFDDLFIFEEDGSFIQEMGSQTWIEVWQGVPAEGCGLPVAPHNGSNTNATYVLADESIVINGEGAYLGLPKVTNQGELDSENPPPVAASITYAITAFDTAENSMTLQINYGGGVWQFKLVKTNDQPPTQTINVTAGDSGGLAYFVDGVARKDLELLVGTTYTFTYPSNHPFRFSETVDGIEYTVGVDKSVSGQISIRVTSSTTTPLYYYCTIHAGMGGMISFVETESTDTLLIQAEDYTAASDVGTENTTDSGGGQNVGWIDANDYMEYTLSVVTSGNYLAEYRIASQGGSEPGLDLKLDGTWVDSSVIPNTGGWQNWQTVTGRVISLTAGDYQMRVETSSGGFNLNWLSFTPTDAAVDDPPAATENSLTASSLVGDWKIAPVDRAMGVGSSPGSFADWASDEAKITEWSCLFDDIFRFEAGGSFSNVMGNQTLINTWQGASAEECGTPVAPHDGSNAASYTFDEDTKALTINGLGAHLGLAKVTNQGELDAASPPEVPQSINYEVVASTSTTMTVQIQFLDAEENDKYWTFKFVKVAEESTQSLVYDGETRSYVIYIPAIYDGSEAYPLMLNFHGNGDTAQNHFAYADMTDLADTHGFILVYPQGLPLGDDSSHWNFDPVGGDNKSTVDDFGFVDALLDNLSSNYQINRDRVYATGFSNGAAFAFGLACYQSENIAAIVSVSGSMSPTQQEGCNPQHPTPVMSIHGTQDSYFLYQGGYYLSMDAVTNYWTSFNQTQTTQPTETVTYDGLIIEKFSHAQGNNGSKVDHYKINGGYHIWFDLDFNGDSTEDLIWNFVSGYDKNGAR